MPIDKVILKRLKNNDSTLTELDLSNQKPKLTFIDMQELVRALDCNTGLQLLNLHNNEIGDQGA